MREKVKTSRLWKVKNLITTPRCVVTHWQESGVFSRSRGGRKQAKGQLTEKIDYL